MLRSAKSSTSFRSISGSTSGLGGGAGGGGGGGGGSGSVASRNGSVGSVSGLWPSISSNTSNENTMHPNLGLHNAAASGNIGLVKFALDNGQPHTSLLNGITPLHAACMGGSEAVVRLLLSYGADVNATRVKASKGSGLGSTATSWTEGSTPLHYAAANGHLAIVRLLVEHGARPTAKDKDGLTPESLASTQGHFACVNLLRLWITSYGPNGLAGLTEGTSSNTFTTSPSSSDQTQLISSPLRNQRSFEQLTSAAAGVKASLRNHKKHALAKVNSNPNLKSGSLSNSSLLSPPSPPPPLPSTRSEQGPSGTTQSHINPIPSTIPSFLSRENKRRPSLPSIFEKTTHPSPHLRTALSIHPPFSKYPVADSIEELSYDGMDEMTKNLKLSSPSPSRTMETTRSHRSASNAESITSKASTSSTNSFGAGLSAEEQAQAIMKTAERSGFVSSSTTPLSSDGGGGGGNTFTLTQMLAAYGGALAQERKGAGQFYQGHSNNSSSSSNKNNNNNHNRSSPNQTKLSKQASQSSLGSSNNNSHRNPQSSAHKQPQNPPAPSTDSLASSSTRVNQGSITPFSTPPDSPQTTRSRAESSATSFSRSPSSNRQNAPPRGMAEVMTDSNIKTMSPNQLQPPPNSAGLYLPVSPHATGFADKGLDPPLSSGHNLDLKQPRDEPIIEGGICASPPSLDMPITHKHSPSLPMDLSQFSGGANPQVVSSSNATTPRSSRKNSHRPTTSDSHSSLDLFHIKRGGSGNEILSSPSISTLSQDQQQQQQQQQQYPPQKAKPSPPLFGNLRLHKTHSSTELREGGHTLESSFPSTLDFDPYGVGSSGATNNGNHRFAASQSNLSISNGSGRREDVKREDGSVNRSSSRGASKRKGTVKAFLNGIKQNVVG